MTLTIVGFSCKLWFPRLIGSNVPNKVITNIRIAPTCSSAIYIQSNSQIITAYMVFSNNPTGKTITWTFVCYCCSFFVHVWLDTYVVKRLHVTFNQMHKYFLNWDHSHTKFLTIAVYSVNKTMLINVCGIIIAVLLQLWID